MSERERLVLEAAFYQTVTGELMKAVQSLTQLTQMYPADIQAHMNLGYTYNLLGQYDSALAEYQEVLRISPEDSRALMRLAMSYGALGRWQDANSAMKKAAVRGDNPWPYSSYWLAFAQNDYAAMQEAVEGAVGSPDEASLLYAQARAEAYHGKLANAGNLLDRALELARRGDESESAAGWETDTALRDAEIGNPAQARRKTADALQLSAGRDVRTAAALVLTRAGDLVKGRELAEKLNREHPSDVMLQGYWLPTIAAAAAMQGGDPNKALNLLAPASTYEMCPTRVPIPNYYAAYLRGLVYLKLGQGQNAAREFQKILDHPGIVWAGITGALARLQIARAYIMAGDHAKAKAAYQDFLKLWKDADPDIPIYKEAKAEYAKLQ